MCKLILSLFLLFVFKSSDSVYYDLQLSRDVADWCIKTAFRSTVYIGECKVVKSFTLTALFVSLTSQMRPLCSAYIGHEIKQLSGNSHRALFTWKRPFSKHHSKYGAQKLFGFIYLYYFSFPDHSKFLHHLNPDPKYRPALTCRM